MYIIRFVYGVLLVRIESSVYFMSQMIQQYINNIKLSYMIVFCITLHIIMHYYLYGKQMINSRLGGTISPSHLYVKIKNEKLI